MLLYYRERCAYDDPSPEDKTTDDCLYPRAFSCRKEQSPMEYRNGLLRLVVNYRRMVIWLHKTVRDCVRRL